MKRSRSFFVVTVGVVIGVSLMAGRPIVDAVSPVTVLQRSDLQITPAGRNVADFLMTVPGATFPGQPPNEIEVLFGGGVLNPLSNKNSAELTIFDANNRAVKHCAHGERQGNVYFFDLNGNGQDSSDPGLIQYDDGFYATGIGSYMTEGNLLSWRLRAEFELQNTSVETTMRAFTGSQVSSPVTRRHGGPVLGYVLDGYSEPYTIDSNINITNPLGRSTEFDVFFRDYMGVPANLKWDGQTGNQFKVQMNPYSASSMNFDNQGLPEFYSAEFAPRSVGGNHDLSNLNGLQVSVQYNTWRDSVSPGGQRILKGSAGLAAPKTGLIHTVPMKKGEGFDTGISIVNVTSQPASVGMSLLIPDISNPDEFIELSSREFTLPPWYSTTQFGLQYFEQDPLTSYDGTVVIQSTASLAVTPLSTYFGYQKSSIPAGVQSH